MSLHADPPPRIVREPSEVQYITADKLGRGGFAICYRAEQCNGTKPTGKIVALKIVRSKMEPQKLAQKFVTELQLHSKLRHPNIVEFYRAFSFEQSTYVVLEICDNGSLGDALKKRKFFTMPEIRRLLIQICGAVKYLHHRNIVHRDLKTGNIFLDADMNVKLGDFGLAAVLVGKNDIGLRRTTMCGTPNYLAPEILEKTGKGHNEKVDLWAIGIIAYTLAVGKAPFHAAKREEIYKNLQTRSYEWPELAQHPNDISRDLQDLVSSLLVDEDYRPCPDQIVSHQFFKMSFIPDRLTSNLTSTAPTWPAPRMPTGETILRGYSDSWFKLCQECGVGEYAPGRTFPVVGLVTTSIVRDVEKEIKAGRAPTVPMSPTMIYTPFRSEKKSKASKNTNLSHISEENSATSSINPPHLQEITANDRTTQKVVPIRQVSPIESKENKPPINPEVETELKAQKPDTALRRARSARLKSTQVPKSLTGIKSVKSIDCLSKSMRATRKAETSQGSELAPTKPTLTRTASRLTSRSRTTSREQKVQPTPVEVQQSISGPDSRDESSDRPSQAPPLRPGARSRTVSEEMPVRSKISEEARAITKQRIVAEPESVTKPPPSMDLPLDEPGLRDTDPESVLVMANKLRSNVLASLAGKSSSIRGKDKAPVLPFVTKWVDYAKKHGIGYVLSDGTVGTIFNPSIDLPVRHVVVRDGPSHLKQISADKTMVISQLPLEFYTTGSTEHIKPMHLEPGQKKANGLLWAKFARYMCSSLNGSNDSSTKDEYGTKDNIIVRYYQRLGNVGVWGFSNGCFQINFPDHTKLVVSSDGKFCSFICLPLDGLPHLQTGGELPLKYVKSRIILSGPISTMLNGTDERPLTKANMLKQKLQYVIMLLDLWIEGGGLGCKSLDEKWPKWAGAQLDDAASQSVDWIIVGRTGDKQSVVVESAPTE